MSSTTPACPWPLQDGERFLTSCAIECEGRQGFAWLSSSRIMLKADVPTPQAMQKANTEEAKQKLMKPEQFTLPLSLVINHMVSPAAAVEKKMKIEYRNPAGAAASVVLKFISANPLEDRGKWKEVLVETQASNNATAAGSVPAAAAAASSSVAAASASASAAASPATATPSVKTEPGLQPAATATAAAPARTLHAKRPHSAMQAASAGPPASALPPPSAALLTAAEQEARVEQRAAFLSKHPELGKVYEELVVQSKVVTAEEFWQSHSEALRRAELDSGSNQSAGLSTIMASAIRPEPGVKIIHYKVTPEQLNAIFLEEPMVYELYQQLVPDKISEKQFWTKYFQSVHFHQREDQGETNQKALSFEDDIFRRAEEMQREADLAEDALDSAAAAATSNNANDAADAAAKKAAREMKKDMQTKAVLLQKKIDPSVDLAAADLPNAVMNADPSKSSAATGIPGVIAAAANSRKSRGQSSELLQKFNRHGLLVLDNALPSKTAATAATNKVSPAQQAITEAAEQKLQASYHHDLSSSLDLVDLSVESTPIYNELPIANRGFLQTLGQRKSVGSAVATTAQEAAAQYENFLKRFMGELNAIPSVKAGVSHSVQHLPESDASYQILLDMTSMARGLNKAAIAAKQFREQSLAHQQAARAGGGGLDYANANHQPALIVFSTSSTESDMVIPQQFQDELKKRFHVCNELFRHFWASFNPRSTAKLKRVYEALNEQYKLVQVIRSDMNKRGFAQLVPLLNPLVDSIETCEAAYKKWNERTESKRAGAAAPGAVPRAIPQPATAVPAVAAVSASEERDVKRIKV